MTATLSRRGVLAGMSAVGLGLGIGMPSIVRGQSAVKIRAAHVEVAAGGTNQALLHMAELVAERSGGSVTIEAFPDGVLSGGSGQVGIDQLVAGAVQMVPTSTAYFSTLEPKLSIFSLPFAFANYDEYYAAQQGELGATLGALVEPKGLHVAGWWPRPFRQLWGSKPIMTPADLAGQRIRTIDNPLYVETMSALGARPVPMAWGEVYTALQLGAIDAIEPDLSGGYLAKMHEVCKFITRWNYSNDALMVTYNRAFWEGLPAETQALLTQAALDAAAFKQTLDQTLETEAIAGLDAAGVTIADPTAEQLDAFQQAAQPAWQKFEATFGAELMALVRA